MPLFGSQLFEGPPHSVDIYLPAAPSDDSGGGVKLNWSSSPDQVACPCTINTTGARTQNRQGQDSITVGNVVSFLTSTLTVTLVSQTKLIATDTGRTFILQALRSPDRSYGESPQDIPQLTYFDADEIL